MLLLQKLSGSCTAWQQIGLMSEAKAMNKQLGMYTYVHWSSKRVDLISKAVYFWDILF